MYKYILIVVIMFVVLDASAGAHHSGRSGTHHAGAHHGGRHKK